MPYHRILPNRSQPDEELVEALASELRIQPDTHFSALDEQYSDQTLPDIQEEVTHRNLMHVRVIWNRWGNMSPEQRGEIILEAYKAAQGEDVAQRISIAMGLTTPEAHRLGFAS